MTVWQSSDGMPNNYVTGLAQTPDGYLWLATYSSLVRFDGVGFDPHICTELSAQSLDEILALQPARDGGLWLGGVHGGVLHLGGTRGPTYSSGLPDRQVLALTEDPNGAVWVAYQGGVVCRLDHDRLATLSDTEATSLSGSRARHGCSFATDSAGHVWFGADGRIGTFHDGAFEPVFRLGPLATRLTSARAGGLWVCVGRTLFRCEDGQTLHECGNLTFSRPDSEPTELLEDDDGGVWIGTSQDGLFRFDGTKFEPIPTSGTHITTLLGDHHGNIWAGTRSGGLNRIRRRIVDLEKPAPKSVRSVCQDSTGVIWATTEDGQLLARRADTWSANPMPGTVLSGRASCVAAGPDGALWIGTRDGVLYCRQGETLRSWRKADGLVGRAIHALVVGKSGDVWIGEETPDVVQRIHAGQLETIPTPDGIRYIRAMTEDAAGNIWVGTSKGILLRIANGRAEDQTSQFNPTLRSIRYLYATPDGGVWFGYADKGLGWLKDGRLSRITSSRAVPDTNVSQIVGDGHGWLWFAGDHGIFKARQSDLEEYARHRLPRVHFIRYGQSEALASIEANWGDSPGAARSSDGRLWFPMRTGLAVIYPDRLRSDSEPPPVFLNRFSVDDHVVAAYGGTVPVAGALNVNRPDLDIRLSPGHHRLEFVFTALSLDAPENVRFRYRLEGLDEKWIDSGTDRRAIYSRLAAGRYRFHVQACNSDGVWNRTGAAVSFDVEPFFWQTWWFKTTVAAWFIAVAATIVRFVLLRRIHENLKKLREQNALDQERARIARDLHDDFGTRLTELGLIAELETRSPNAAPGQHRELIEHIRSMERDLDAIVWAVNPKNDSLDHLVGFVCRTTAELFNRSGTRCRLHAPEQMPALPLTPDLRHNLFLIMREAVANVVKHADASEVALTITVEDETFHFRVEDDGHGFIVADAANGDRNGLKNMATRVKETGGRFSVESELGRGTRLEFWVPLKPGGSLPPSATTVAAPLSVPS